MKKTRKALLSMILSAAMVIAMLPGMSMVVKAESTVTVTAENLGYSAGNIIPAETWLEVLSEGVTLTLSTFIGNEDAPREVVDIKKTGGDHGPKVKLIRDAKVKAYSYADSVHTLSVVYEDISGDTGSGGGSSDAGDPGSGSSDAGGSSTPETHIHDWDYRDLGNGVLRAECTCEVRPTLTIVAPDLSRLGSGSPNATLLPDQLWTDNNLPTNFTINYANFANGEHCDSAPTTAGEYIAAASAPHPKNNNQTIYVSLIYTISASSTSGGSGNEGDPGSGSSDAGNPGSGASDEGGAGGDSGNSSDAQQEGSNDSILFAVGDYGFDIQGKDGNKNIQTTFSNRGYVTRMQVGSNSTDFSDFAYGKKYSYEGIEGNVTASLNGNSVAIVYTLKNTTNETKSVKIGSYADTQIGDDDDAPVSFTNKGIQMISKDGKYAFVVNPGNADFTTRWYGSCGERSGNVFNNRTDSETFTSDSGVAWSWSVEVPANSTVTRTAILAAGSAESIIEPQSDTNKSTATIAVSGETAVKGENPIVPNLNSEAASQGDDVTLDMQITADPETTFATNPTLNNEPEVKEEVKGQFKDESTIKVDVLHINVRKLVAGVFAATLTNTNSVLEIGVGYNFTGKYDPSLVSKHGDEVRTFATLTARPTAGNYINSSFFADTENDKFYIYSKDYSDFVISYSTVEGNAQNRTVIDPNAGGSSSTSSAPKTIPVYRLFNKVNGNHLFTTNAEEKDILVANGWADEGIAWQVVANTATPVYRLFDAAGSGEHYYTANEALKAELIAKGCVDEGVAWYGQAANGRTVYKVTNTKYGKSVLTTSVEEKEALVAAGFAAEEADFKVN
ncbi:hypothetical protein [Pseudobutyrivibrio xylanivorans]|uniref:DUF5648 domain-containing protein n=1 Tax=Pseudobutyrivibrio xylanivorans DSM 14809 TaxID=1123012 RepID=A0A1M6G709_PSEXY|nr:hypothetical protein [Pseudobutyrivibrio xylanivorans]SHJ05730.1 hypothetical protein SAMN02745725_01658 [Pseudobutyrivibrio xylanivorans DSM 14809]